MENDFFDTIKEETTVYGKVVGKVGKLHLINVVSRVLGLFLLIFTLVLCALALFTFGAVAAIDALAQYMPVWAASLIIGSTYIILIAVVIIGRKQLFINPFIRLMSKQLINSQEHLEIETLKAEHEMELQTVRLETRVENATRELDIYVSLVGRIWSWLTGKMTKS